MPWDVEWDFVSSPLTSTLHCIQQGGSGESTLHMDQPARRSIMPSEAAEAYACPNTVPKAAFASLDADEKLQGGKTVRNTLHYPALSINFEKSWSTWIHQPAVGQHFG